MGKQPLITRAALSAALWLAATPLVLAANHQLSSPSAPSARSDRLGTPPRTDVKPFDSAKLSLTQAIADAQKEMRGKTLDARFEVWQGRPAYLIRTYSANQVWESRIDANTGQPIGEPSAVARSELGPAIRRDVAALDHARTSLEQAIGSAEQQQGGRAVMASVRSPASGRATYAVDLVTDGRLHTAMIDTATGQPK